MREFWGYSCLFCKTYWPDCMGIKFGLFEAFIDVTINF